MGKKSKSGKLERDAYEAELERLQGELVALQEWVKRSGARIVIVFEGRDTAGKGGVISRLRERTSHRIFREVALPAPTERELSQMYLQRYVPHLPAAGEVVIFDRSWYNRAGVERVMGFCTPAQLEQFFVVTPEMEHMMVSSGIILLKYWLEVSEKQQMKRIGSRIDDPRKVWKLSGMDVESYGRWYDYSRARDEMLQRTSTDWAPWHIVDGNDKKRARLNTIRHILDQIPYEPMPERAVELPPRQEPDGYVEPDHSALRIVERY